MNTSYLQYIKAIAQSDSLTRAAKLLGISQPALCGWLDNIESQLGTRLVIRSKKRIMLTPAGKIYLAGAQRMMECQRRMLEKMDRMGSAPIETIRIAGTPNGGALVFARIFSSFKTRFPSVQLQFIESYNAESIDLVRTGDADFAVCSAPDPDDTGADCYVKRKSELAVMVPRNCALGYDTKLLERDSIPPSIELSLLKDFPFLMPDKSMSYYNALMNFFKQADFTPNTIFQSSNTRVLYEMVCSGNGAAVVPLRFFNPKDNVSPFLMEPRFFNFSCVATRPGSIRTPAQEYMYRLLCELDK